MFYRPVDRSETGSLPGNPVDLAGLVVYLKRSGGKFFIVDTKEWLVDNIDIQRVLPQPSLDNRDRYDFGEIDI